MRFDFQSFSKTLKLSGVRLAVTRLNCKQIETYLVCFILIQKKIWKVIVFY